MFSWATEQLEKISLKVAPPPTDAGGKFVYCCQRRDEAAALELVISGELVPTSIVVESKQQRPLHVACHNNLLQLVQLLVTQPGVSVETPDKDGNTALHCAGMSAVDLSVVHFLVDDLGANVLAKNAAGQTAYDVSKLNTVRQYLLPLQLQKETAACLANGGQGLIPGMDMGGLKITGVGGPLPPPMAMGTLAGGPPMSGGSNSGGMPSSPVSGGGGAQPPPMPAPPSSGNHAYARCGSSSAALGVSKYQADGFHSSSSDKRLQQKYGHVSSGPSSGGIPPPPTSAGGTGAPPLSSSGATNPYAGGYSAFRGSAGPSRYVNYDPVTGGTAPLSVARGVDRNRNSGGAYPNYNVGNTTVGGYNLYTPTPPNAPPTQFNPAARSNQAIHPAPMSAPVVPQQQYRQQEQPYSATQEQPPPQAPASHEGFMPPPPFSSMSSPVQYQQHPPNNPLTPGTTTAVNLFGTPTPTSSSASSAMASFASPPPAQHIPHSFSRQEPVSSAADAFAEPFPPALHPAEKSAAGLFSSPPVQQPKSSPQDAAALFSSQPVTSASDTNHETASSIQETPPAITTQPLKDASSLFAAPAVAAAPAPTSGTFSTAVDMAPTSGGNRNNLAATTTTTTTSPPSFQLRPFGNGARSVSGASTSSAASDFFSSSATSTTTASDLFSNSNKPATTITTTTPEPAVEQPPQTDDDDDDAVAAMDDIPLSPKKTTNDTSIPAPQPEEPKEEQPQEQSSSSTSSPSDLFSAIGMPPPPFSSST